MSDTIDPPHSRLFVLCGKSTTYDDLKEAFEKYGAIEDIWIVKDKASGEPKGVVYIKFSKTSAAALAAEEMHGKTLDSSSKPLKVMVAHSRDQGSKKDDDFERLVRLFIVVPRTTTEEEVREHFEQYGKVESVNIVKNRDTGESKGFAYVKYSRPFHAARAFEQCPKSYKAVFAKPREVKPTHNPHESYERGFMGGGGGGGGTVHSGNNFSGGQGDGGMWGFENRDPGGRLLALVPAMLREQHIYRLFDLIPGLQMCRPLPDSRGYEMGQQKILVQYASQQGVQHALEKFNGFEYPPGHRISVKLADAGYQAEGAGGRLGGTTTISNCELATLTSALAKAESIIKSAGLGVAPPSAPDTSDPNYCSIQLPPPKPLATRHNLDSPSERLFIVCQPGLPPMYALRDVFGRFGDLIEVYVINGKNCGYVSYASKEAAENAIETLHLQEVCGMRLKVMKAEPPRGGPHDRKRIRMDTDDN